MRCLPLGHRGARGTTSVAENTPASFDLALQHGCAGFEFDVRMKGCGNPVICHDPEVNGINVASASCNQLLQLPDLAKVMDSYADRAFLDIELKVPGLESQVLIALKEHAPQKGYVVSSFLPDVLTNLRDRSDSIVLGFICDKRKDLAMWKKLPTQYLIPHFSLVTRELVREVHAADRSILTWTVNDKRAMLRLRDCGVDGIISDKTDLLVKTLTGSESAASQGS